MKQLKEEMLVNVSGGDYGDSNIEKESGKPLYQIGEEVEVYNTAFHIWTTRGTIIGLTRYKDGYYQYNISYPNGESEIVCADFIERR